MNQIRVIGIHPVDAEEPVHLVELEIRGDITEFNIGEVTQAVDGEPEANWQAPWDERELERGLDVSRIAFFFHYLDANKPLLTSAGDVVLPPESPTPLHLSSMQYEQP